MCCVQSTLNEFLSLGKPAWAEARSTLTRLLSSTEGLVRDDACLMQQAVRPMVSLGACSRARTGCMTPHEQHPVS
jgi:hypothetical protein